MANIISLSSTFINFNKKVNNNYNWKCNTCNMIFNNNQAFYYCSLCDFYLCQKCAIQYRSFMNNRLNKAVNNNGTNNGSNFKVENKHYYSNNQL